MRLMVLFFTLSLLAACNSVSRDMKDFEKLYEFDELSKHCSTDSQCKLVDTRYVECGRREVFVYSSLIIRGENEQHMLSISNRNVQEGKAENRLEECLGAPTPHVGICWKNGCEIIRTWRR